MHCNRVCIVTESVIMKLYCTKQLILSCEVVRFDTALVSSLSVLFPVLPDFLWILPSAVIFSLSCQHIFIKFLMLSFLSRYLMLMFFLLELDKLIGNWLIYFHWVSKAQKFWLKPCRFFDEFLTIFISERNNLFQYILGVCRWNRLQALPKLLK